MNGDDEAKEGLPKRERLRGRARLDELFARGRMGTTRLATARLLENGLPFARVAVVTGRACGNAAQRNRLRRRLRAAFRTGKAGLPAGVDVVLMPRRGAAEADWPAFADDVRKAITRAVTGSVPPPRPPRGRRGKPARAPAAKPAEDSV